MEPNDHGEKMLWPWPGLGRWGSWPEAHEQGGHCARQAVAVMTNSCPCPPGQDGGLTKMI